MMRADVVRVGANARWVLAAAVVAGLACGGDGASPVSPVVAAVALSTPWATLSLAATQRLTPVFTDQFGNPLGHVTDATWTSSDSAIATVNQSGNVRGVSLGGPVTITVAVGVHAASVNVTVVPDHVAISPASTLLVVNEARQLEAAPVDFYGAAIPSAAGPVTWVSTDSSIATVGANTGLVTGRSSGLVTIYATAAGATSGLALEVGVPSQYDGTWVGASNCVTCTPSARTYAVTFNVLFGKLRGFYLTVTNPPNAVCSFSVNAMASAAAPVTNAQVAFSLSAPAGVAVTGTFDSPTTMSGTHGAINLGPGCSVATSSGTSGGGGVTIVNASVPSESFTAARQ